MKRDWLIIILIVLGFIALCFLEKYKQEKLNHTMYGPPAPSSGASPASVPSTYMR